MSPCDSKLQFFHTSVAYVCSYCLALSMYICKSYNCRYKPTTILPCIPLIHKVYIVLGRVYYNIYVPVCIGYFPVMMVLRLGVQIGDT